MWIRTQNKQRIINSDQIVDIFVDKTELKVMASTRNGDVFTLGEYKDRDTCLIVLSQIPDGTRYMLSKFEMPL